MQLELTMRDQAGAPPASTDQLPKVLPRDETQAMNAASQES